MTHENAINVFTDGSSFSPGPRRGGMGLRLVTIGPDGHDIVEEVELCAVEAPGDHPGPAAGEEAGAENAPR